MSISLRNRLAPIESSNRYVTTTFRATSAFHGKAIWDCATFGVEGLDGRVKIFFGRCLACFCDAIGDLYIALRWFEASNGDRNGALLIPNGDIFYALKSPRENDVYLARNL